VAEWGWVAAGYSITALGLFGYVGALMIRAGRARRRAAEIADRRQ
jgi:hypothetical protein